MFFKGIYGTSSLVFNSERSPDVRYYNAFSFIYQIEVTTEILDISGQFPSLNNAFHEGISDVFCHGYPK
jgi:hypothetical protein